MDRKYLSRNLFKYSVVVLTLLYLSKPLEVFLSYDSGSSYVNFLSLSTVLLGTSLFLGYRYIKQDEKPAYNLRTEVISASVPVLLSPIVGFLVGISVDLWDRYGK